MKQLWCLLAGLSCLMLVNVTAQTFASEAAAIAQQQKIEEEFKRLNAIIEELRDTQALLLTRIERLTRDLEKAREENQRSNRNLVTQEELKRFAQEVDQKREADKKLILKAFDDLSKIAITSAPQTGGRNAAAPADWIFNEFTVGQGQTLTDILNAYNKEYRAKGKGTITLSDILKANPNMQNPDRIVPGQKIMIPELAR